MIVLNIHPLSKIFKIEKHLCLCFMFLYLEYFGDCMYVLYCSVTHSCPTLCNPVDSSTPGLPVPHHLLRLVKFMFIVLVMPSTHLILWCSLLLLPSIFLSIRDFSNESSVPMRWPKYWSISFGISPSREYSGLISLKIDWIDFLAVQGTFRSLL